MAYFATVVDGIVTNIETVSDDVLLDADGVEVEELGSAFLASLYTWVEGASFVQAFDPAGEESSNPRGKYPSIGDLYLSDSDEFVTPIIEEALSE